MVKFPGKPKKIGNSYWVRIPKALVDYGVIPRDVESEYEVIANDSLKKQPATPNNNSGVIYQPGMTFCDSYVPVGAEA